MLTEAAFHRKKTKKAARRVPLRERRRYLLRRYGSIIGEKIYRFERSSGKKPSGSMPKELAKMMKQADTYGKVRPYRFQPCLGTTGETHRTRRKARLKK